MAQQLARQERTPNTLPTLALIDQALALQNAQPQSTIQRPSTFDIAKNVTKGVGEGVIKDQIADAGISAISSLFPSQVATQGAAGYNATAAALPELFGGTSAASAVPTSSAIMSQAPAATTGVAGFAASAIPITFAVASALAIADDLTKSKKGADQRKRDAARSSFANLGITDKNYVTPTGINVGKDLSEQAGLAGIKDYDLFNKDGAPVDPLVPFLVSRLNPVSTFIAGGDSKLGSDTTGLLVKTVLASKPKNEAEAEGILSKMFANFNVDKAQIAERINASGGGISDEEFKTKDAKALALNKLYRDAQTRGGNFLIPEATRKLLSAEELSGLSGKLDLGGLAKGQFEERKKLGGLASLLTKAEQENALAQLQRANFIRG